MTKIGFIGLGTMGGPMAGNIVKGGYDVKGFDINPNLVENHINNNGIAANSAAEAAINSDILFTMLPNAEHVRNSLFDKNFSQSCVPMGNHLKIYSAPNIANKYDFKFLLIVATNIIPLFFIKFEHLFKNRLTSDTCSITSIFKITSNSFSKLKFSGEQWT